MLLPEIIQAIHPLDQTSFHELSNITTQQFHPKGYLLLQVGKIDTSVYLIESGAVRAFSNRRDEEINFWFGFEGDPVVSMMGYVKGEKSYETVQLMEPTVLYRIDGIKLQALFKQNVAIANWGRKLIEYELIKAEQRLIAAQSLSAKERYAALLLARPHILQKVPLGYIASFLGITQVSLSRIRAEIR